MVQADGCTFARFASNLCLILTMLFTLGVGQMWATDLYVRGERNSWGTSEKMDGTSSPWTYVSYWSSSDNKTFKIATSDWSTVNKGSATISAFGTKYKMTGTDNMTFPTVPTGGGVYKIIVTLESGDYYIQIDKLLEEESTWRDITAPKIYWDNTAANYSNVSMLNGRYTNYGGQGAGSGAYSLTHITNTNLWYTTSISNASGDASKYTTSVFINGSWSGWEGSLASERAAKYATNYTASNCISLNSDTYLFKAASGSNNATLTGTKKTGGWSDLNYTQTLNQELSTDGGSSYSASTLSLATVTVSAYKLKNATTAENNSGTIAADASSTSCVAAHNNTVTYTVSSVETGYTFVGWYEGVAQKSTSTTYTYRATAAKTVKARFKENQYTVSRYASGSVTGGSFTAASPAGQITGGNVSATPSDGYHFSSWSVTSGTGSFGSTTTASTKFYPTSNSTVKATFAPNEYEITLDANGGDSDGSATATYLDDDLAAFSGASRAGYTCDGYFDDPDDGEGNMIIDANGNLQLNKTGYTNASGWSKTTTPTTLYAHWTENLVNYTVTYAVKSGQTSLGTLSCATTVGSTPISSGGEVASGTGITFTASPITGYEVDAWCSNEACTSPIAGAGYANTYSTTVSANTAVYVKFKKKIYTITYSPSTAPTGCTYTTKPTTGTYGNTVTMKFTPSTGYTVSVSAKDASSNTVTVTPGANNTYTFTQPASAVTVTVTATETMSSLSTSCHYDAGNPSYSSPTISNSATNVGYVTQRTITAPAAGTGYNFVGWTLTNCTRTDGGGATDTPITIRSNGDGAAASVVANYEEDLSTTWTLKGDFVDDFATAYDFEKLSGQSTESVAYTTLNLSGSSTYHFQVIEGGTNWRGNTGTMNENNCTDWTFTAGSYNNCGLETTKAGSYRFKIDFSGANPVVSVLYPSQFLVGSWDSWDQDDHLFDEYGYCKLHLTAAGSPYEFKVKYNDAWYGLTGANFNETKKDWLLYLDDDEEGRGDNMTLTIAADGDYVFGWNGADKKLSVIFPADTVKAQLPENRYLYFDSRRLDEDHWNQAAFSTRFWLKNYASGLDYGHGDCSNASVLEGGVYYTLIPTGGKVGQVQLNRMKPDYSEMWNYTNKVYALDRANAQQNCLIEEAGNEDWWDEWTPQWSSYAPPLTALALNNNSTTTYGGSGTKANPYIVNVGDQVKVRASGTKAVNDDNMTIYYTFKDNATTIGSEGSSATCNYSTGAENATHKMTVTARNRLLETSTYGTVKTTSDTVYYTRRVIYTDLTASKSPAAGSVTAPTISSTWAIKDNSVTVTAYTPATGYRFTGWTSSNGSFASASSLSTTFTPTAANAVAVANYELINYTITHSASTNGSYTIKVGDASAVSTNTTATYGQTITLAATPANVCYELDHWTVTKAGGGTVTVTNNQFNMPDDDVTVAATFRQKNLAYNKTVVAGYEPGNAGEHSEYAVDGSTSTQWTTYSDQATSKEWIYVDLGACYQLNRIEVLWGDVYSTDYILQVRHSAPANATEAADDSKWYTVAEVTDATASTTKATTVNNTARYVRMHSLTRSSTFLRVYEFRVFGTGTATTDNTAPVISAASFKPASNGQEAAQFDVTVTDAVTAAADMAWTVVDKNSTAHSATYSAGVLSVTGLPSDADQSVTIYAMDEAANISSGTVVNSITYVNPNENLALNKTRYACIDYNVDEGKAKANDGNESTYMTTYTYGTSTNEWWYVDLGAFYEIRRIEVVWMSGYHSTNYSIQYRQNAPANNSGATSAEWDAISAFTNKSGNQAVNISDVYARYICLRSTARNEGGQLRLAEVRVFGKGFGTPDDDEPEWTTTSISAVEHTMTLHLAATDANPSNIYNFVINVDNGTTDKDYERTTTALSDAITITDAEFIYACHSYTVTAKCYDHVGNEASHTFSIVIPSLNAETNIFSGATATVDAGTASVAIDGNTGSRWTTGDSDTGTSHWILVDIGEVREVSTLKIAWETACPKDYYIEGSADGTNYYPLLHETEVPTPTGGSFSGYTEYDIEDGIGVRYVKVRSVTNNTGWGMSIFEMQAYGSCYEASSKPVTTFAREVSQVANSGNTAMNAIIEVGAYDESTTYANMYYIVTYSDGDSHSGSSTVQATSGQITLNDLHFDTDYTVTVTAKDGASGNTADNTIEFNISIKDQQALLYARTDNNGWHDAGLLESERFGYINGTVMHNTFTPTKDVLSYILYYDSDDDQAIEGGEPTTSDGNQVINGMNGREVTIYAKDQNHFVSNADLVYVVGSAVRATEANAWQMTQSGTTFTWEGYVSHNNKFKIIVKAQKSAGIENAAFNDHSRARIMADSATFTDSYRYAKLIFDLETWTYSWSDPDTYIFTGSNNSSWSNTSNWVNGTLPTIAKDVIITKPVTVDITTARANSVVLDQSGDNTGQLVLDAGKELVVAETVRKTTDGSNRLATGENDLVFNSTSGAGLGALVMGTHDGTNNATVNFATLSNGAKDNSGSDAQYIGTPFSNSPKMLYQFYNSWMYKFVNTGVPGWTRVDGEDGLDAFQGYCIFSADGTGHTYWMQGTLVASTDQTISLRHNGGDGSNANNENMLANSWMAPIQIRAFDASDFTNADATIYIYNTGSPDDYHDNNGATSTGTQAGQYSLYTVNTCPTTAIIPSMQAFSVYTHGSTPSISLDYSKIVYDPAVAGSVVPGRNRAPQRTETDEPEKMRLYIGAESGYGDMLYMLEREDFAEGFENGWDGRKMFGEDVAPQLYAFTPDGNMAINCIPTFEGQLLGFRKGAQDNTYTFTFEYDGDNMWYLNDLKEQTSTLISAFDSYTFTSEADDTEARFIISRSPIHSTPTAVESATGAQQPAIRKIVINDHVFIIRNGLMYDVTGIMVR